MAADWNMPGRSVLDWDDPTVPPGQLAQPTGNRGVLISPGCRRARGWRSIPQRRVDPNRQGGIGRSINAAQKARAKRKVAVLNAIGYTASLRDFLGWNASALKRGKEGPYAYLAEVFPDGLPVACDRPLEVKFRTVKKQVGRITIRSCLPTLWDCARLTPKEVPA